MNFAPRPLTRQDFEMVCIGQKDFGFRPRPHKDEWLTGTRLVQRYSCSHLEAERRFKLWLIKQRMLA